MTIFVSSNEPSKVRDMLGELAIEVPLPFDFLLFTENGPVARERKTFPDDFLASVSDGRFARECAEMRGYSSYPGVILEGSHSYTKDGYLRVGRRESRWRKQGIRNMLRTLKYVEGCDIELSSDISETVEILKELQQYFDKGNHASLHVRPPMQTAWGVPSYEEKFTYWLQGCGRGVSIEKAKQISKLFNSPKEVFSASVESLMKVPGIGQKTAESIYNFLHGGRYV